MDEQTAQISDKTLKGTSQINQLNCSFFRFRILPYPKKHGALHFLQNEQTDGSTVGQTDGQTDGLTLRGRI